MESTPKLTVTIDQLRTGSVRAFGPNGEPSAIDKLPTAGPLKLTRIGFEGDDQADKRFHGGPEKAIHHYPAEHYAALQGLFPETAFAVGGFGENLSSSGITEQEVCLGDIFSLGGATVQLSQGRQPCWKLNVRFQQRSMAKTIQQRGWTGWYYRVLEEGEVAPGDRLVLIERPWPQANLAQLWHLLYQPPQNSADIRGLLELPVLPPRWRQLLEKRLESGLTEDDSARLQTPTHQQEVTDVDAGA